MIVAQADRLLAEPDGRVHKYQKKYDTDDIVSLMIWSDQQVKQYTEEFSKLFTADRKGMRKLFEFLATNIRYQRDKKKTQVLKSPALLWEEKEGDCKSFTLFVTSVAQNIGLPYFMRFTSYRKEDKTPKHVYPVVIINGKEVPVDVVYYLQEGGSFGTEKKYAHKTDYKMREGLAFLSGTVSGTQDTEQLLETIVEIEQSIPDSILEDDVTKMDEGTLQRRLMAERLEVVASQQTDYGVQQRMSFAAQVVRAGDMARIGAVEPELQSTVLKFIRETKHLTGRAITGPKLRIILPDDDALNGLFKKVGNFFKRIGKETVKGAKKVGEAIGDAFKKAWAKLANWIFKGALQKAGPFFLFTFLRRTFGSREIDRRKGKQKKVLSFFRKLGMKESNVQTAIKNGVIEHMGATPDKILNDAARGNVADPQISGVAAAIISAVGWIIKIIEKLANLFKKDKGEVQVGNNDTSDLRFIDGIAEVTRTASEAFRDVHGKVDPNQTYGNTGVYTSPEYQRNLTNQAAMPLSRGGGMGIAATAAILIGILLFI
ncbi:MAG: hypothetical protein AAF705_06410 [Bacteroidota bacterium]